MNLLVDIGNTLVKCAVSDRGAVIAEERAERLTGDLLDRLLTGRPVGRAIVCSTRGAVPELVKAVRERVGVCLEFTQRTPVPIGNAYRSPETLGLDRLAAAVGAAALCPGRNVLIVDAGTALTVDLVTADGVFRGGCISPGLRMRLQALHDHTAALPLCEPSEAGLAVPDAHGSVEASGCPGSPAVSAVDEAAGLLGGTTEEALVRGAMQSVAFEIEGYANRFRKKFADLCIIFTGGDAHFFVKRMKNTIFANCNPIFCGLDRILEYNVREKYLG